MVLRGAAFSLFVAAAQGWAGCGSSIEPIEVAAGCPGKPIRGPLQYADEPADLLISDFETGLQLAEVAGRDGQWVEGSDGTSETSIVKPSAQCVANGKWSGHFVGRGFTSWGMNWTAVFRPTSSAGTPLAYDGRGYTGISFWAAFGGDDGSDFEIPVGITTMDTAWNSLICNPCTDHYMTKVPLTHQWQRFEISFAEMVQSGVGSPLLAMRRDQMVGFIIWPRQDFDIWIDEVRFMR